MMLQKNDSMLLLTLRIGTLLCFAGWAWVHFYWQGPYGVLLWQHGTYELAERWGISWDEFVGSGANDGIVQKWIRGISWLYLGVGILALTVHRNSRWQMVGLVGGAALLVILAYAKYISALRQLPMFIEHGGQILMPILLVSAMALGVRHRVTVALAVIAVILTFSGHGTYALGEPWPTPPGFYGMTRVILGVNQTTALSFVRIAGILDFVVCLGLLVPILRRYCALYAVAWGFLTALARPWAGMSSELNYWGADQYLHELVIRAPHFLIPLYLFLVWRQPRASQVLEPVGRSKSAGDVGSLTVT